MGIQQYEQLIHHAKDQQLKEMLQKFQKHAKLGAQKVADRIKQLGGDPVDGVGILGEIRLWMSKFKGYPTNTADILQDAYIGENKYGIHMSHDMVAGDLDEESTKLVDEILEEDQKRVDQMVKWLKSMNVPIKQS